MTQETLTQAIDYRAYSELVNSLALEGKTSGEDQSESRIALTKLNVQRVKRIERTVEIIPQLRSILKSLKRNYLWLVLSESWCADSAQNLPVINMMAELSDNIDLKILLRDENPAIMDNHLTNGARSIPKLISMDPGNMKEYGTWGPRPQAPQAMMSEYKKHKSRPHGEVQKEIQLWYARDKGESIQWEFINLFKMWEPDN